MISGGMISRFTWEGVSTSNSVPLMAVRANVWYRGLLKIGANGDFIAEVWERDNPAAHAQRRETKAGGWTGLSWNYTAKPYTGGLDVDNYDELSFNTTRYTYDPLNNLTRVTDALANTTVITYNALSRKTDMFDPDMGKWS